MLKWLRMRHYWLILISQVILLFLSAFLGGHFIISILFIICLLGVFGSVIETIWEKRLPRILALISGLAAVFGGLLHYIPGLSLYEIIEGLLLCTVSYAVFIMIAIIAISRYVFFTDRITADRVIGSICIYMLIGMFFSFVYAAMALSMDSSFALQGMPPRAEATGLADFIYFSYATLTTIGYGDMIPIHPITKMTSVLEGVTGCVYLAIMVARLVGMHVTQSKQH